MKRVKLPAEFHHVAAYRRALELGDRNIKAQACEALATIFENRQQYPRAAEFWQQQLQLLPAAGPQRKVVQRRLDQILKPWCQLESRQAAATTARAEVDLRFRNGSQVAWTAQRVDIDTLMADVMAYIESKPKELDWSRLQIEGIGHQLVEDKAQKYLREKVAEWTQTVEPRAEHMDRRVPVTLPLPQAGAYLVTANMQDGNTSQALVWVADTAIVQRAVGEKTLCFVADAMTGQPITDARLNAFGYNQQWDGDRAQLTTRKFAENVDADGVALLDPRVMDRDFNWLIVARNPAGRMAFYGFNQFWTGVSPRDTWSQTRTYVITDRPVYRPEQTVYFKAWTRDARYELPPDSQTHAGEKWRVRVDNPRGEAIYEQELTADAYASVQDELQLPKAAVLGSYQISGWQGDQQHWSQSFRVEEYKKPEFEVTVTGPAEPVSLGDQIEATIAAKYYFGSPVTAGTVKYTVKRTTKTQRWYPRDPWDWLYGSGYWWFASDATWHPGWKVWGCPGPIPPWWDAPSDPPEVVLENEVPLGPDGTVKVQIDTAIARAMFSDRDHSFAITAEVVDQSRRVIVGQGEVLATRQPFQVFTWQDRGHYTVGQPIEVSAQARRADGKTVAGKAAITLLRVTSAPDGEVTEVEIESASLDTDAEGGVTHRFQAGQVGQYRARVVVTTDTGLSQEGGSLFIVRGGVGELAGFEFDGLGLTANARTFAPGETARLLLTTPRVGGTALVLVRAEDGADKIVIRREKLAGQATELEVPIELSDMPNTYVEVIAVMDGEVQSAIRELAVPPQSRTLQITTTLPAEKVQPGEEVAVEVTVTDENGQPVQSQLALTVYDRALEYISGGSNVEDIQEFFWKFRRSYHSSHQSSLQRMTDILFRPKRETMSPIGVFGNLAADTDSAPGGGGGGMFGRQAKGGAVMRSMAMPMAAAPMMEGAAPGEFSMVADVAGASSSEEGGESAVAVRSQFADTAFWVAAVETNAAGKAQVTFRAPENLTDWSVRTWGLAGGTRVGEARGGFQTHKELLVRIQAPRFFVEQDRVLLSANVHNDSDRPQEVRVDLAVAANLLAVEQTEPVMISLAPHTEQRVDWWAKVVGEGLVDVTVTARGSDLSDAMRITLPAYIHGFEKVESFSGVVRGDAASGRFTIRVPDKRRPEQTRLEVRYSPTLAGAMVDALPYLVNYEYACTEQTLNRFVPTVITQKILRDLGVDLAEVKTKRANLNAQQLGDPAERAAQWRQWESNPVFDNAEVEVLVKANISRLSDMQNEDGGWGWFSGAGERSWPHTTAVVVQGLTTAQQHGIALYPGLLEQGVGWLKTYQQEQVLLLKAAERKDREEKRLRYKSSADNLDALVYGILVQHKLTDSAMRDYLFRDRLQLSVYGMGLLGLALHAEAALEPQADVQSQLSMVLQNIDQYLVQDNENQTAYLQFQDGYAWWYWHGDQIEANAVYLKLLARTDPRGQRASRLVKYLLNNRKHGSYWKSTRDTALCVEALAEFLAASGENDPQVTLEVLVDGDVKKTVEISQENMFSFDDRLVLSGDELSAGQHTVELRRKGASPIYWNAYLTNFTLETGIQAAGLELKVERKLYRLVRIDDDAEVRGDRGQVVSIKTETYRREPLLDLGDLVSGDLVEVELAIDSKNDYEYVILEDFKAAGCEAVDLQSGYLPSANGAYVEFRDNRTSVFLRTIDRGRSSVSFRLRAEVPGTFHALPTRLSAMYAPELRGNSDEIRVRIADRE